MASFIEYRGSVRTWVRSLVAIALVALGPANPSAALEPDVSTAAVEYEIPFEKYVLSNGLEVILSHDPALPLAAVSLWYHVGPANEPAQRSGFAHLFEHLMFEGSLNVRENFDILMESIGATNVNGTTSWDRTNYFATVPSEQLELVLWLESDRMGYMVDALSPERLEVQRAVVKNERRQSFENSPYGPTALAVSDTLFPEGHPYHGAVIGSMEDLERASMEDVREFFDKYYAPHNATLAIVGSFEVARTKHWIEHYFASLPARGALLDRTRAAGGKGRRTPPLDREVVLEVKEPVQLSQVTLAWLVPPAFSEEEPALEVLSTLLADGKATRLYRRLVEQDQSASEVSASLDANDFASVFEIQVKVSSHAQPQTVVAAIDQELERVRQGELTLAELERAKRRVELTVASDLQRLNGPGGESGRAGWLQRLNHYLGDPGALLRQIAALRSVTAAEVQRVAQKQLPAQARVLAITRPSSSLAADAP